MKRMIAAAILSAVALAGATSSAEGPKDCAKDCEAKYQQCVKEATEYGHSPAEARAGCAQIRSKCKARCD